MWSRKYIGNINAIGKVRSNLNFNMIKVINDSKLSKISKESISLLPSVFSHPVVFRRETKLKEEYRRGAHTFCHSKQRARKKSSSLFYFKDLLLHTTSSSRVKVKNDFNIEKLNQYLNSVKI